VLSNGLRWQIYKVLFQQPIDKTLLLEWDVAGTNPRDPKVIECLGNLTKEGFTQSSMNVFYQQQQAASRFSLAVLLQSERVLKALRKELRAVAPKLRIETSALAELLRNEVLKREVIESDEAKQAVQFLKKAGRSRKPKATNEETKSEVSPVALPVANTAKPT
jgi:hypothetical protein